MNKNAVLAIACLVLVSGMFFAPPRAALADTPVCEAGKTCLINPLTANTPEELIRNVLKGILSIVGSLALLMFIYGGFTWMLSGGNAEGVKKGRDILMWASIGLVIIFTSYAIISFIFKALGTK